MRFKKQMKEIVYYLEAAKGFNILQCVYCKENTIPTAKELARLKDSHYKKIDLSDGIYVVNINGYIGESVQEEIEYAKKRGKEIIYHCNREAPLNE